MILLANSLLDFGTARENPPNPLFKGELKTQSPQRFGDLWIIPCVEQASYSPLKRGLGGFSSSIQRMLLPEDLTIHVWMNSPTVSFLSRLFSAYATLQIRSGMWINGFKGMIVKEFPILTNKVSQYGKL